MGVTVTQTVTSVSRPGVREVRTSSNDRIVKTGLGLERRMHPLATPDRAAYSGTTALSHGFFDL